MLMRNRGDAFGAGLKLVLLRTVRVKNIAGVIALRVLVRSARLAALPHFRGLGNLMQMSAKGVGRDSFGGRVSGIRRSGALMPVERARIIVTILTRKSCRIKGSVTEKLRSVLLKALIRNVCLAESG